MDSSTSSRVRADQSLLRGSSSVSSVAQKLQSRDICTSRMHTRGVGEAMPNALTAVSTRYTTALLSRHYYHTQQTRAMLIFCCFFAFFFLSSHPLQVPSTIFVLFISHFPSLGAIHTSGVSKAGYSPPPPITVRACFFIASRIHHFVPSSTHVELCFSAS